jgi:ribonuclease HI
MDNEIYAFFDGACTGNGYAHSKAGYGSVIKLITRDSVTLIDSTSGIVEPKEYVFINNDNPLEGFKCTDKKIQASNNRGEYLGFCHTLLNLLKIYSTFKGKPPVTIVSDSLLCINTMEIWLPNRKKKKTEHELKNPDLIKIVDILLTMLRQYTTVRLQHIRSHRKAPEQNLASGPLYNLRYISWEGNNEADILATSAIK